MHRRSCLDISKLKEGTLWTQCKGVYRKVTFPVPYRGDGEISRACGKGAGPACHQQASSLWAAPPSVCSHTAPEPGHREDRCGGSLSSCSAEGPSHGTGNLASEGNCPTHLTGLLHGPMEDFNHPQDPMPFSENSQNLQIPRKANKSERPPISAVVEKHIQEFSVAHSLDAQTHKTRH